MARLAFYVLLGLEGDAMLVWGGVEHRGAALVLGLVVALGSFVMLATGWWLKWEETTGMPVGARVRLDTSIEDDWPADYERLDWPV